MQALCPSFLSEYANMNRCDCQSTTRTATTGQTITQTGDYREIDRRPLQPDKMDMGGSE